MPPSSKRLRSSDGELRGREIFEITPIILGGSPTDPQNKVTLSREQHIQAVRYWNLVFASLRQKG